MIYKKKKAKLFFHSDHLVFSQEGPGYVSLRERTMQRVEANLILMVIIQSRLLAFMMTTDISHLLFRLFITASTFSHLRCFGIVRRYSFTS
jgi:hypothetical protein